MSTFQAVEGIVHLLKADNCRKKGSSTITYPSNLELSKPRLDFFRPYSFGKKQRFHRMVQIYAAPQGTGRPTVHKASTLAYYLESQLQDYSLMDG